MQPSGGALGERKTTVSTRTHPYSFGAIIEQLQGLGLTITYAWLTIHLNFHTGEVQGSIPCASTKNHMFIGPFGRSKKSISSIAQNVTQTRGSDPWKIRGFCSRPVSPGAGATTRVSSRDAKQKMQGYWQHKTKFGTFRIFQRRSYR